MIFITQYKRLYIHNVKKPNIYLIIKPLLYNTLIVTQNITCQYLNIDEDFCILINIKFMSSFILEIGIWRLKMSIWKTKVLHIKPFYIHATTILLIYKNIEYISTRNYFWRNKYNYWTFINLNILLTNVRTWTFHFIYWNWAFFI